MQVVAALPAVGLGVLQPEQTLGGQFGEDLVGEPAIVLPLLGVWGELAFDEPAGRLSQLLVLVGEGGEMPGLIGNLMVCELPSMGWGES